MIGAGSGWAWVGVDGWLQSAHLPVTTFCDSSCADLNQAAVAGVIGTQAYSAAADLQAWQDAIWNPSVGPGQLTSEQQTLTNLTSWAGDNMNSFVPFAYDAAYACGLALHALCFAPTVAGVSPVSNATECKQRASEHGDWLLAELKQVDFGGPTGHVFMDAAGDRPSSYDILNVDGSGKIVRVGVWGSTSNAINTVRVALSLRCVRVCAQCFTSYR